MEKKKTTTYSRKRSKKVCSECGHSCFGTSALSGRKFCKKCYSFEPVRVIVENKDVCVDISLRKLTYRKSGMRKGGLTDGLVRLA